MSWTPAQIPSLSGRTAVVTGANSGIGLVTAAELARHGARVVLACRKVDAAERAAEGIRALDGRPDVSVAELDLASLDSVERFAAGWSGPLDLLVNNAGVMMPRSWRPTAEGHELQFGTNHLGHFALTARLLPALLQAPSPRVVTVASLAHRQGGPDVLDGNPAERATSRSGPTATASWPTCSSAPSCSGGPSSTRPGSPRPSRTPASRPPTCSPAPTAWAPAVSSGRSGPVVSRVLLQSAAAGANPTLYAATEAEPGSYTGPSWLGEMRGPVGTARRSAPARDAALASALWERSEELTGVRFAWPALRADGPGARAPARVRRSRRCRGRGGRRSAPAAPPSDGRDAHPRPPAALALVQCGDQQRHDQGDQPEGDADQQDPSGVDPQRLGHRTRPGRRRLAHG